MIKKPSTVQEYQLESDFEKLRSKLLGSKYEDRRQKPLAFWAVPSDRRLPMAFLDRQLQNILETDFRELLATPGVGQKKIASLIRLLRRATQDQPPGAIPTVESKPAEGIAPPSENGSGENKFDPEIVSEALWVQWTETVRRHDYSHVKLGRLAPTLQHLPTVIWHTPLRFYLDRTVAEIRNLKTHGEKRVRAVLEVFSVVHHSLAGSNPPTHLSVWLMPKFIQPVQQWIFESIARSEDAPSVERARADLAEPLVEQIRTDIGDTVAALAAERLGFSGPPTSVRQQAKKMGVTRARVYQLLDECAKVMEVRWPEGAHLLAALEHHIERIDPQSPTLTLLRAARDLFYPQSAEPMHEHDQPMVSDAMRPRHDVLDRPEVAATS